MLDVVDIKDVLEVTVWVSCSTEPVTGHLGRAIPFHITFRMYSPVT